ncbi:MAG TPA: arylamine N-acetyltransferase [Holophagaceae bacterium]|nr:arylamine N-acetyltransferase [Holophagaceae bacterium]
MTFNLDAYLARIGYAGAVAPTRPALFDLHRAHAATIPFENLDIQMGLPIRIDLEAVQAKLVDRRRGGYCFEQNTLFRAALEAFGFTPQRREARVRFGAPVTLPRTHGVHTLICEGREWLVDVGFGGEGILEPIPLDGTEVVQSGLRYRLLREGPRMVLQRLKPEGWFDLYALEPEPVHAIDWEMGNHFTSTFPESRFVLTLTAQRPTPEARHSLRGATYTCLREGVETVRELRTHGELMSLLREAFGLELPEEVRFRALDLPREDAR